MAEFNGHYYDHQLRSYLIQFMAIFADMKVQVGWKDDTSPRLIKVPIKNASEDRIVADILSENTQNKANRLPVMSAALKNLQLAPDRRHGVGHVTRTAYLPSGGLVPHDMKVAKQRMPVPYLASFDLGIWASNQDQHYQILEQILMIFNPTLEIQTSDAPLDPTRISTVELIGIGLDENPPGTERRLIQTTLSFDVVVYLACPAQEYSNIVHDIYVRVAAVSNQTNFKSNKDIIASMEDTGLDYELWFSSDDIDFPQV